MGIREIVLKTMARKGHTVAEAERAAGMKVATLHRFLCGQTLEFNNANSIRLAQYIDMPERETISEIRREAYAIRSGRQEDSSIVYNNDKVVTWWGTRSGEPPVVRRYDCEVCPSVDICRESVMGGGPMLCERFLKDEVKKAPHELQPRAEVDFYGVPVAQ